jgi:hypothetical protein
VLSLANNVGDANFVGCWQHLFSRFLEPASLQITDNYIQQFYHIWARLPPKKISAKTSVSAVNPKMFKLFFSY